MSKAHKAPVYTHRRKFWVTDHARARLRSRIARIEGEDNNGTEHRGDDDLDNLIDSLVQTSIEAGSWDDIVDEGIPAKLVDIRHPSNRNDLWAIIKDNTSFRSRGKYPKAVVTLLYTRMVEVSRTSGKWDLPIYDDKDVLIGGLDAASIEALQSIKPTTKADKVPEVLISKTASILITYLKKGERVYEEWGDKESAESSLNGLRRDSRVDTNSIRVFREVFTEARIVL